jgi:hypothetical protein
MRWVQINQVVDSQGYISIINDLLGNMAERVGFEPTSLIENTQVIESESVEHIPKRVNVRAASTN